jgi:hypothetical protein
MLYRKNVGTVERVVRIVAGCSLMACGYMVFGQSAMAWVAGASGLITIATGIVGFCPACAIVGRGVGRGVPSRDVG